MEWNSMESAPAPGTPVVACGFPLEPFSLRRGPRGFDVVWQSDDGDWNICGSRGLFEPFGWMPIPIFNDDVLPEKSAEGKPKFEVGQEVFFRRSDGEADEVAVIESIIDWPSGWWYEFLKPTFLNNIVVGGSVLYWEDGRVAGRPAMESELYISEN